MYKRQGWSGDAIGFSSPIDVIVDDNKNVVANFSLVQYALTTSIKGEGSITETIVNTGKSTDYDSGTTVQLEAVPSKGYYFAGWSGGITGESNPSQILIDRPKNVTATFKKLSYELRVLTQGEGTVKEEIINTSKSTDYEYETTVRLTATPEEGSDFIEWEDSGALTEQNPYDVIITEPKLVKAVFEYDLFNLGVGKWKIKKPKQSQKTIYNVYSIIFNRNRSFRLNYSSGQISGTYSVTSNSNIVLNNYGSLSNVQINNNQIGFNLNITDLFQFDVVGSRVQTYQQNRTYIPDQNFEQALVDVGYDTIIDSYIDDSNMLSVTQLDLSNKQITDFTGLEEFVNLTDLNLSGNTITSVPLVNLNQLTTLNLSNTGLTELDLSQNNNISSLDLSGNTGLSCVKVNPQVYQQVPSGWIYDSPTSFELECDCPTLSLISGASVQELCDGDAIQSLVYEFGGIETNINVDQNSIPPGLTTDISNGTLTISGTPIFNSDNYSFSVFTTDGNTNCSQVSQTITLTKNSNSPSLTVVSGSLNQSISIGAIDPIVVSYGGTATALSVISGSPNQNDGISTIGLPPTLSFIKSGQTFTLQGSINTPGTYNGIITTNSNGGCTEITRAIQIVVTAPDVTNTSTGNTTTSDTSTTSDANTSSGTSTTSVASSSSSYSIDVTATNSSNYTLSGSDRSGNISGNDPDLIFNVGDTIDFVVNASGHPFYLKTIAGTGIRNTVTGLNNNGTTNQTISWTPTSSGTFYYQCSLHGGMVGTITIQ